MFMESHLKKKKMGLILFILQGSSTSDCMSKTLDSASAHFAASAVVSAPVPSRSESAKEQNTGHNNINGVVQPSGKPVVSCGAYYS